jgi:tetratricopeptide (TPR) repeat protein
MMRTGAAFRGASVATLAALLLATAGDVRADDRADARAHYEKARAAYALGRYVDAAAEFEQAFTLKPDPAILYNAAQAYRLGGKKARALELYRNYRRVYGRQAEHPAEVDKHIAELEKSLESDRRAATTERPAPANLDASAATAMPAPILTERPAAPMPVPAAPPPAAPTTATVSLVSQPAPAAEDAPVYRRWWFWAGAGVVAAAVVVGVALATRKSADCGTGLDYCANTGL